MELLALFYAISFWSWISIFLLVALMTILVESERGTWATVATFGSIGFFCYMLKFNLLAFSLVHPLGILKWLVIWFAVGTGWGTAKWFLEVHKSLGKYQEAKAKFLANKKVTALTPELAVELNREANGYYGCRGFNQISATPPKASEHKADIIRWMTYWPFSMIGFVLRDFVRRIWNHIYTYLATTYDRIAKYVYRDVAGDADLLEQGQTKTPQP